MPAPNRPDYDRSRLDWDRLRRYAQRVAFETPSPLAGPLTYTRPSRGAVVRTERRRGGLFGLGRMRDVEVTDTGWLQETDTALGPHWLVDTRNWSHVETKTRAYEETTTGRYYLALLPDGALKMAVIWETVVIQVGEYRNDMVNWEAEHTVGDADQGDLCRLDFARRHFERTERRGGCLHRYSGDREPGQRLLKHAKGVGVNLALKALLEGRSPLLP